MADDDFVPNVPPRRNKVKKVVKKSGRSTDEDDYDYVEPVPARRRAPATPPPLEDEELDDFIPVPPKKASPKVAAAGSGAAAALAVKGKEAPSRDPRSKLESSIPETTIGKAVAMKGELNFESLLRIDGRFEGALSSSGSLIVGRSGVLVGDISGMVELLCEGKVIGNVSVERAELRGTSSIFGNITCKSLIIDSGATIVGSLNVNPFAPERITNEGVVMTPEEIAAEAEEKKRQLMEELGLGGGGGDGEEAAVEGEEGGAGGEEPAGEE